MASYSEGEAFWMRPVLVLMGAALLLSGCGGGKFVGRPDLKLVGTDALPAPTKDDLLVPARPYAIGPGDQLAIDVYGVPEVGRTPIVDPGGQISLPLVGTITASGLSAPDLAAQIADRLRSSIRDPKVTVNIMVAASQTVTVDGAVGAPGVYPVQGRLSLMRAIARASGTSEFARNDRVVVFRRSGGSEYATLYDLGAIRAGMYADPEIYSNDVIVVGDSQARRIFKDVLAASGLITAPVIALLR